MRPERSAPSAVAARWNARTEPSANCLLRMAATRVTVILRGSLTPGGASRQRPSSCARTPADVRVVRSAAGLRRPRVCGLGSPGRGRGRPARIPGAWPARRRALPGRGGRRGSSAYPGAPGRRSGGGRRGPGRRRGAAVRGAGRSAGRRATGSGGVGRTGPARREAGPCGPYPAGDVRAPSARVGARRVDEAAVHPRPAASGVGTIGGAAPVHSDSWRPAPGEPAGRTIRRRARNAQPTVAKCRTHRGRGVSRSGPPSAPAASPATTCR